MSTVASDQDVERAIFGRAAIDVYTELKSVCRLI